uniref:Protein TIFY n=2 Tax=Triticum urartu TaxID=4572 RepID=A0A8R7TEQ8_TRIUA
MAASARQGERATSFAMACSLLSRYVRQNGAAAAELGLGINKGEAEAHRAADTKSTLPGAEGEEAGRKKETMELFPQSAGLQDAAAPDATREEDKSQLTIFYGGKVLVFNDFPADKAKGLMQLAGKGSPVVQNVSATTTAADTAKVQTAVLAPASSLPSDPVNAHKSARPNASGNYPVICCTYPLRCLTCTLLVLIVLIIDKIFSVL